MGDIRAFDTKDSTFVNRPVGFSYRSEDVMDDIRTFDTGATRDNDTTKFDYDGFNSPLTMRAFAEYMHKHRVQTDGSLRASDNWKKGIPLEAYRKSLWRHFMDVWSILSGWGEVSGQATDQGPQEIIESLCGLKFNADGLIHELMKARIAGERAAEGL